MAKRPMKLVRVSWVDSCGLAGGGWHSKSNAKAIVPDQIKSVGYVVKEAKEHVTLAAHVSEFCYDGVMCIPRSAISKIEKL